eukprot:TRINITY_DN2659_c0_g1_i6.p1 TRINITY_DN2659_c0_g1~~TRINITY_DN2659_c0_g1_i6.p1  ORF type:complete len:1175 (-),score=306.98 TRINITY_DN2659_c0_g1_i6:1339-4374(-)
MLGSITETDPAQTEKQNQLKARIIAAKLPVRTYSCKLAGFPEDGRMALSELGAFCDQVREDLWAAIEALFPLTLSSSTDLDQEEQQHAAFAESRVSRFYGRVALLQQIGSEIDRLAAAELEQPAATAAAAAAAPAAPAAAATQQAGTAQPPGLARTVVLLGQPGCGKSAVMAKILRELSAQPGKIVAAHFVGASPASINIRMMLKHVCQQLAIAAKLAHNTQKSLDAVVGDDYDALTKLFSDLLDKVSAICVESKKIAVVVLDALNQLSADHNAHLLHWLPKVLPSRVVIVASTLASPLWDVLRTRPISVTTIPVGALTSEERVEIVRLRLAEYGKKLDERESNNQMAVLLEKEDASRPLFLGIACEELRVFGEFEQVGHFLIKMSPTVEGLFEQVFTRLEHEHGEQLVASALSLIAVSRGGGWLLEDDMLVLLAPPNTRELQRATWSRLFFNIAGYLRPLDSGTSNSSSSTLEFFHGQAQEAVNRRYLHSKKLVTATHSLLGKYYYNTALNVPEESLNSSNVPFHVMRAISEAPHHLLQAGLLDELKGLLCNFQFIEEKAEIGMIHSLVGDYMEVIEAGVKSPEIEEFSLFVRAQSHLFEKRPYLVLQQAINCGGSIVAQQAAMTIQKMNLSRCPPVLYWANRNHQVQNSLMTLDGHTRAVSDVCVTPDSQTVVSVGMEGVCVSWDINTGKQRWKALSHNSSAIYRCIYEPVNKNIITVDAQGFVSVWDENSGALVLNQSIDTNRLLCVCADSTGKFIVFGGDSAILFLYSFSEDRHTLTRIRPYPGHPNSIVSVHFLGNLETDPTTVVSGRMISACMRQVVIWDVATAAQLSLIQNAHDRFISGCLFSRKTETILTSADDAQVRFFSHAAPHRLTKQVTHHRLPINDISFARDENFLVACSTDLSISVFSLETDRLVASLRGHANRVSCVTATPDSRYIISGSDDRTVKLWSMPSLSDSHYLDTSETSALSVCDVSGRAVSSNHQRRGRFGNLENPKFPRRFNFRFVAR